MAIDAAAVSLPVVAGPQWKGAGYFTTTRNGGQSSARYASLNLGLHTGDDPADVLANRRRLRSLLPADPLWLDQVHGTDVADADGLSPSGPPCRADAAVTTRPDTVLAILTADCLPVVIGERNGRALGLAHAGWRGLCHGVLEATLQALQQRCPGSDGWRAWIGPAIGPDGFEVGDEVLQAFVAVDPASRACFQPGKNAGKWMADLPALAALRLRRHGVTDVAFSGLCTYARPEQFFSYRRQPITGRMVTCAWLRTER